MLLSGIKIAPLSYFKLGSYEFEDTSRGIIQLHYIMSPIFDVTSFAFILYVLILSIFSAIFIGIVYSFARFLNQCWILREFRGPFAIPILGNCYTPQALAFMKYISDLRKRYGPIFTFFAMGNGMLIVSDPVVVRRILSDSKTFCKGMAYTYYFRLVFGDGLVTSEGEKHKSDRSLMAKYFVRSNVNKYVTSINELTREALG